MSKIDMAKQAETISRLRDELNRLNRRFDDSKAALGVTDAELAAAEKEEDLPAEMRQALKIAKDAAEKAGRNAVASLEAETAAVRTASPLRLRRGMAI